jgi:hypothetical protein
VIHIVLWLTSVVLFVLKVTGIAVATLSWWVVALPALVSVGFGVIGLILFVIMAGRIAKEADKRTSFALRR